ncbi:MAG TPA: porin family protein [Fluviicola sp.]|nr:porin family protein [Fluviicola sp.]
MKTIRKIVLIALLTSPFAAKAQDETDIRERLTFGLKVGTNYSNVYDSEGEEFDADAKFGFVGGAFVAIPIGKLIGIQPEILYSQKGFQGSGRILGGYYEIERTTNYIDVPVFFVVKPMEFVTIMAGPQFSYLISQKDVFSNGVSSIEQEQEFENDDIRKNTLCFVGGLDVNVRHFVIGGRAGWDLFNNNGDGTSTTPRYKNVWLQATVAYRFY